MDWLLFFEVFASAFLFFMLGYSYHADIERKRKQLKEEMQKVHIYTLRKTNSGWEAV